MDHHTPKRGSSRLGGGEDQVVPDVGAYGPPGHDPLGSGIRRRGGDGVAFVFTGPGADPHALAGATSPPFVSGQDVTPGRKVAGHPRHKARHTLRQEVGHAEPGIDHQDFIGVQGGSCLP